VNSKSRIRRFFSFHTLQRIPLFRSLLAFLLIRLLVRRLNAPPKPEEYMMHWVLLLLIICAAFKFEDFIHKRSFSSKISPPLGDLLELYAQHRFRKGSVSAAIWLCHQLIASIPPLALQAINLRRRTDDPEYSQRCLAWFEKMTILHEQLTEDEKNSLYQWGKTMVDGSGRFATSDWPGWEKHIGLPPWK